MPVCQCAWRFVDEYNLFVVEHATLPSRTRIHAHTQYAPTVSGEVQEQEVPVLSIFHHLVQLILDVAALKSLQSLREVLCDATANLSTFFTLRL